MPKIRLISAAVLFGTLAEPYGDVPGATHCGAIGAGTFSNGGAGMSGAPSDGGNPTVGAPEVAGAATRAPQFGQNSAPGTSAAPQVVQFIISLQKISAPAK